MSEEEGQQQSGEIEIVDIENDQPNNTYNFLTEVRNHYISLPNIGAGEENITVEEEVFTINFPVGWSIFSFPFDTSTITKIEYIKGYDATNILHTVNNPSMHLQAYFHHMQSGSFGIFSHDQGSNTNLTEEEFIENKRPNAIGGIEYEVDTNYAPTLSDIFAGPLSDTSVYSGGNIIIIKDYSGAAYLPEWNFNGIGSICQYEGLQIKTHQQFQLRFHAKRNYRIVGGDIQYGSYFRIGGNWSLTGFGNKYDSNMEEVLEPCLANLIIAKDYLGAAYMPQWNFNGVGDMKPGQGYQVKLEAGQGGFYFFLSEEP